MFCKKKEELLPPIEYRKKLGKVDYFKHVISIKTTHGDYEVVFTDHIIEVDEYKETVPKEYKKDYSLYSIMKYKYEGFKVKEFLFKAYNPPSYYNSYNSTPLENVTFVGDTKTITIKNNSILCVEENKEKLGQLETLIWVEK